MSDEVIKFKNVFKSFGETKAINDLTFTIPRGSIVGFLGPNGAGKSTSIGLMFQFLRQDSGEIDIFGENVKENIINIKKRIGLIPDSELPKVKGETLLRHTGRFSTSSTKELNLKIEQMVRRVGAESFYKKSTQILSRGQRQRLKIANAMINDPELIIADEPSSGLDPISRDQLLKLFNHLVSEEGKTIFFSNHVVSEIEQVCDRLLIISRGKLVREGTYTDILEALPIKNRYALTAKGITAEELATYPDVVRVEVLRNGQFIVTVTNDDQTPEFLKKLTEAPSITIYSFSKGMVDLSSLFKED